jgi:hypothetical protein
MFFSPRTNAALAVALAAASCRTAPLRPIEASGPPAAFVAWLCADVARTEFVGSDPLPYHGMAPVTRCDDGSFEIRYEQREDGRWSPRANGRIGVTAPLDGELPATAAYASADGMQGAGSFATSFVIRVESTPQGVAVHCDNATRSARPTAQHIHDAIAFATSIANEDADPKPCCTAHAPWRAQAHLRVAMRHHQELDLVAARSAMSRAFADAPMRSELNATIAHLDLQLGQDELARTHLAVASRFERDPLARAQDDADANLAFQRMRDSDGDAMRARAADRLANGDVATARALALAASAEDPDPIADLALRHRLQGLDKDLRGSLGTALLLREYGAGNVGDRLLANALAATGHQHLAERAEMRTQSAAIANARSALSPQAIRMLDDALRAGTSVAAPGR